MRGKRDLQMGTEKRTEGVDKRTEEKGGRKINNFCYIRADIYEQVIDVVQTFRIMNKKIIFSLPLLVFDQYQKNSGIGLKHLVLVMLLI